MVVNWIRHFIENADPWILVGALVVFILVLWAAGAGDDAED